MNGITRSFSIGPLTIQERTGQFLHTAAELCIRPIDYVVEQSMHNFTTAIIPGKFGNQSSYSAEAALRVTSVAFGILSLPLTLTLYGAGLLLDKVGDLLQSKPYDYLQGSVEEKKDLTEKNSMTFFSANLCMLPYGIFTLGGVRPPSLRIKQAAEVILQEDKDFVCLQEMALLPSLALWEELKGSYAHGFTRIGPMPASRMGGALFFASKYPVQEIRYHPLTDEGPIARGVFCAKTEKGWIINAHLSAASASIRKLQMQEVEDLCRELSQDGKTPCFVCMDSNICRTGKPSDEYRDVDFEKHFTNGFEQKGPFVLTEGNATYTNRLQSAIRGKKDPEAVEDAFEHVDYILSYKQASAGNRIKTSFIPGYDLKDPERALSDHHIALGDVFF